MVPILYPVAGRLDFGYGGAGGLFEGEEPGAAARGRECGGGGGNAGGDVRALGMGRFRVRRPTASVPDQAEVHLCEAAALRLFEYTIRPMTTQIPIIRNDCIPLCLLLADPKSSSEFVAGSLRSK